MAADEEKSGGGSYGPLLSTHSPRVARVCSVLLRTLRAGGYLPEQCGMSDCRLPARQGGICESHALQVDGVTHEIVDARHAFNCVESVTLAPLSFGTKHDPCDEAVIVLATGRTDEDQAEVHACGSKPPVGVAMKVGKFALTRKNETNLEVREIGTGTTYVVLAHWFLQYFGDDLADAEWYIFDLVEDDANGTVDTAVAVDEIRRILDVTGRGVVPLRDVLYRAAMLGRAELVDVLLDRGGDPRECGRVGTAWDGALRRDQIDVVRRFAERFGPVGRMLPLAVRFFDEPLFDAALPHADQRAKNTALLSAAAFNPAKVAPLIAAGACKLEQALAYAVCRGHCDASRLLSHKLAASLAATDISRLADVVDSTGELRKAVEEGARTGARVGTAVEPWRDALEIQIQSLRKSPGRD